MFREIFGHLRTLVARAIVRAVDDSLLAQVVVVQSHDGVTRTATVHQPFGFASVPPENGAIVVLLANGGDPSDLVALAAACPSARLGNLQKGEAAVYGTDGTRVHIKLGGIVHIAAASRVIVDAPDVQIEASGGVAITGSVSINGSLSVTGDITATGHITGH